MSLFTCIVPIIAVFFTVVGTQAETGSYEVKIRVTEKGGINTVLPPNLPNYFTGAQIEKAVHIYAAETALGKKKVSYEEWVTIVERSINKVREDMPYMPEERLWAWKAEAIAYGILWDFLSGKNTIVSVKRRKTTATIKLTGSKQDVITLAERLKSLESKKRMVMVFTR